MLGAPDSILSVLSWALGPPGSVPALTTLVFCQRSPRFSLNEVLSALPQTSSLWLGSLGSDSDPIAPGSVLNPPGSASGPYPGQLKVHKALLGS